MPQTSLMELARQTKPLDRIRWVGQDSNVEKPRPRTVQEVLLGVDIVEVEAEGPEGGTARFRVEGNGQSTAWYGEDGAEEEMGSVWNAELVDKDLYVRPWR